MIAESKIKELEKHIGYSFKNIDNLILALTHSSYANETRKLNIKSNERVEFLGDAILNVVVSDYLYRNYTDMPEGELTRIRANTVCESSLVSCAKNINLGDYLLLGKGELHTGGRNRPSILADAYESVIGAIFLDGGIKKAREFILRDLKNTITEAISGELFTDYKTSLQEELQKNGNCSIIYSVIKEKGPDHDKIYVIEVIANNNLRGVGIGKSKKEAEQNAAKDALEKLNWRKI